MELSIKERCVKDYFDNYPGFMKYSGGWNIPSETIGMFYYINYDEMNEIEAKLKQYERFEKLKKLNET